MLVIGVNAYWQRMIWSCQKGSLHCERAIWSTYSTSMLNHEKPFDCYELQSKLAQERIIYWPCPDSFCVHSIEHLLFKALPGVKGEQATSNVRMDLGAQLNDSCQSMGWVGTISMVPKSNLLAGGLEILGCPWRGVKWSSWYIEMEECPSGWRGEMEEGSRNFSSQCSIPSSTGPNWKMIEDWWQRLV